MWPSVEAMDLILSTSRAFFLAGVFLGCSSSSPLEVQQPQPIVQAPLVAGPTQSGGPFVDRTEEYGLSGVSGVSFFAVDLNGDHYTDLVVLPDYYALPDFYYYNPKTKRFEQDKELMIPPGVRASSLYFHDFNRDGVLDVVVMTLNQRSELTPRPLLLYNGFIEQGKLRFREQEKAFDGPAEPAAGLAVVDFDLDGKLDIYQANWFDMRTPRRLPTPDRLWRGDDGKFIDETGRLLGEKDYNEDFKHYMSSTPSFGVSACDVDQNGFPDFLVTSSGGHPNKMWLNLSEERYEGRIFRDYGETTGFAEDDLGKMKTLGGGHSFFALCTDYNNNGLMDMMLGELAHPYDSEERDRSSFLTGATRSFPPEFIRTEYHYDDLEGAKTQADRRGVFVDLNRDGLIDVLVDNSGFPPHTRLIAFIQNADHSFEDRAEELGLNIVNPAGTIVLDLNRDGRMDIITGQTPLRDSRIPARLFVFENQMPFADHRSIKMYLEGDQANREGLGALVKVRAGEKTQTRYYQHSSGGQSSQNEAGLFVGLGSETPLEWAEITWPILNEGRPLKRRYSLNHLKFERHLELTFCESGKVGVGRNFSCGSKKVLKKADNSLK